MKKSIIKLNVLIFSGLLGLGLMTSPIDAEEGQESRANEKSLSTEVIYNSTEYEIDPLDVIYMTVPADVNLTKTTTVKTPNLSLTLKNGKKFNDYDGVGDKVFEAIIHVYSKYDGYLKSVNTSNNLKARYQLRNFRFNNGVDWDGQHKGENFIRFRTDRGYQLNTSVLQQQLEFKINPDQISILENADPGSQFSDVLTFKIATIKGNGFKSYIAPTK